MMPKDVNFWWVAFVALTSHTVSSFLKYYYTEAISWKQSLSKWIYWWWVLTKKTYCIKIGISKAFCLEKRTSRRAANLK